MKKLLLTTALCLLGIASAWANKFTYQDGDGYNLEYEVNAGDTTVTCIGFADGEAAGEADLVIPEIVIDNSTEYYVTSIGDEAFAYCYGLSGDITIPNSVVNIGDMAFTYCSGLSGDIIIPNSVMNIGNRAFSVCSGLTEFTVGEDNANYASQEGILYSKDLTILIQCPQGKTGSLTIPNSVTSIGDDAFWDCSGLTGSLTIPNGVESIGSYAFSNCSGLSGSLTIPNSVESIGNHAFMDCSGFTEFIVGKDNANYASQEGILYNKDTTTLIKCPSAKTGSITIPNSVMSITSFAFDDCSGLSSLTIPNSVESIGDYAFSNCSSLSGILTIPNSVKSIGWNAFEVCSGLTEFIVGEDNANYASQEGILYNKDTTNLIQCPQGKTGSITIPNSVESIKSFAFDGCSGLSSLTIGNSVESIGDYAFRNCSGLSGELIIHNSVETIGNYAFSGCSGLSGDLTIPNSVESIGNYAFSGCSGFTEFIVGEDNANYASQEGILYNKDTTTLILCPGSLTGILTIPNSVVSIGDMAFSGCSDFTEFIVGEDNANYASQEGILYNKDTTTLILCPQGKTDSITIPNSVTSIENFAFWGCSGLSGSLTISNNVESIGWNAFYGCSGITEFIVDKDNASYASQEGILYNKDTTYLIQCPGGLTGILTIPNSVVSIGYGAVWGCSGLTGSLTIPNSVETIESQAFRGCSGFTNVYNYATTPQVINKYIFDGVEIGNIDLYVPAEAISAYESAAVWQDFKSIKIAPEISQSVKQVQAPAPFTQVGNTLYFSEPIAVAVYNISGAMLYSGTTTEYTLPSRIGVYVVCTEVGAFKIMNRE